MNLILLCHIVLYYKLRCNVLSLKSLCPEMYGSYRLDQRNAKVEEITVLCARTNLNFEK